MKPFELARPANPREASELLAAKGALALAGGQDLLALMKDEVVTPERLVDLKTLPGLNTIDVGRDGALSLGALVTLAQIAADPKVRQGWPVLARAAGEAATPQIRNLGTVGGNLCQRPRCWYYRAEPLKCLRKGGDACLAVGGDHRYHSILGVSPCIAPNYSALAIPGTALGASVRTAGPGGGRTLTLVELYAPVTEEPRKENALRAGEFITHLVVPAAAGLATAHEEVRYKQSHDWPLAMATAALRLDGKTVRDGRLVLGGVSTTPYLADQAIAALKGKALSQETAQAAAEAVMREAHPLDLNAYKVPLTRNLIRRVLLTAAGLGETR